MEETISLKELFQILRKRFLLIVLITVIAMAISGAVSFFVMTPIYEANTQLLVNQNKNDQSTYNPSEIQTNLQLINTYNVIIKSPRILDIVIDQLDLNMSAGQLMSKISVQSERNSQVVNVSVQDPDPTQAVLIANTVAEVFQTEIVELMNVDNVNILTRAEMSENATPVKPKPLLNIAIALVVGLMLGVGIVFLIEYLDNTIKTTEDVEKILGLPVLGSIASIDDPALERSVLEGRHARVRSETIG